MEYRVFFSYEKKTIQIECNQKDQMQKIFERFAAKLHASVNDFEFLYEGNKIDKTKTFSELINNENIKEIVVFVEKKLKIIKCPQCICNDCVININDYKIKFSDCKYNHDVYKIYDEYKATQKMDLSKIVCCSNKCGVNQKDNPLDFFKCLKCTQLSNRTRYYCYNCNEKHKKCQGHITIKYDEKNYYCEKHFKQLKNYCPKCKKDLCDDCKLDKCEKDKMKHNFIEYKINSDIINKIKTDLNKIKENIDDLRFIIDDIKDHLDGAMKILEQYYEFGQDIFEKYELYNQNLKNHRVFQNLKNLNESNEKVMKDLNEILNNKDLNTKINKLINIYEGDRKIYKERVEYHEVDCDLDDSIEEFSIKSNENYLRKKKPDLSKSNKNQG
jgi:hypothetical protein